jgi:hypothetical protein
MQDVHCPVCVGQFLLNVNWCTLYLLIWDLNFHQSPLNFPFFFLFYFWTCSTLTTYSLSEAHPDTFKTSVLNKILLSNRGRKRKKKRTTFLGQLELSSICLYWVKGELDSCFQVTICSLTWCEIFPTWPPTTRKSSSEGSNSGTLSAQPREETGHVIQQRERTDADVNNEGRKVSVIIFFFFSWSAAFSVMKILQASNN